MSCNFLDIPYLVEIANVSLNTLKTHTNLNNIYKEILCYFHFLFGKHVVVIQMEANRRANTWEHVSLRS